MNGERDSNIGRKSRKFKTSAREGRGEKKKDGILKSDSFRVISYRIFF